MSFAYPDRLDITVAQLKGIYEQLQEVFNDRLDLVLPEEQFEPNDPMRREVQVNVQNFVNDVMDMAIKSLRVIDVDDGVEEEDTMGIKELLKESEKKNVEPFDLELNEKVRQAYQEWEDQTVKVAQLRENGPRKVNELYMSEASTYLNKLDSRIDDLSKEITLDDKTPQYKDDDEDYKTIRNIHEATSTYHESLQNLYDTEQRIPEIRSNIDKLKHLVAYLEKD
ncbi:MIND complex subunit NSL1 NDAI_0F01370 [Naumovozyma dairenensis CBS 421]|uniref:Uncharacterized protein n=1 Tax=Naumovozyma dairenensis (strain ATCC 10597 / BCRC 20456 / CBS 421 / NBRC 0211 / NRRL Y-12639) TaxID=1071378 RepID=G0WCE5_NAUDC|nr:hypothetical protein NDAI_0F01370 [Naumovozyma dairenensis CBS 421]CCD25456.1 hypothetical protein NDAI_0F01370 [Naumovozyma dairenensis CBS 421]